MEMQRYQTATGDKPFDAWFETLRDGLAKVLARLTRLAAGNPGDSKAVGGGVLELRGVFVQPLKSRFHQP